MPEDRASQPATTTPPRAKYAAIMAIATVAAVACAGGVASMMGASERVVVLAAMALAAGSFATFIPAVLNVERQSWGLVVLGSSMVRMILVLAIALFIDKTRDLGDARTAFWIGTMCGAIVLLIVESAVAVRILASMDRSASVSRVSRPAAHA